MNNMTLDELSLKRYNTDTVLHIYGNAISQKPLGDNYPESEPGPTREKNSSRHSTLKTLDQFFASVSAAFPDCELNIDNLMVKGDKVMARYTISGTHQGDFMGLAPSHQRVTIAGLDVFRLDKGKVVEHWDAAHQISVLLPIHPAG